MWLSFKFLFVPFAIFVFVGAQFIKSSEELAIRIPTPNQQTQAKSNKLQTS